MKRKLDKSLKMYEKALRLIGGGSQMLIKRPDIFKPAEYPIYAERNEGPYLFDVDGNKYIDYLLAYGAILFGYNYKPVMDAVIEQIKKTTIHSINHPLEIELAEEMVKTIPSAEMVRYFLSGSEATSAAIKIARGYTGRAKVVKWGYHGWHDWCATVRGEIPQTMKNYMKILNQDKGLINTVPMEIGKDTLDFTYNNLDSLKEVMEKDGEEIACVIMEPFYMDPPKKGFLEDVMKLAHKYGSIYILDEVKTGGRVAPGGAQEYFNIIPDLSVFSKATANGYPFSAVVGKKEIMRTCDRLWYAGTNAGNTIGIAAALATIREIKRTNTIEHIWKLGEQFINGVSSIIKDLGIEAKVKIGGLPPMPFITFTVGDKVIEGNSVFLSECIDNGIFLPKEHCLYISYTHTKEDIDKTLEVMGNAFRKVKELG